MNLDRSGSQRLALMAIPLCLQPRQRAQRTGPVGHLVSVDTRRPESLRAHHRIARRGGCPAATGEQVFKTSISRPPGIAESPHLSVASTLTIAPTGKPSLPIGFRIVQGMMPTHSLREAFLPSFDEGIPIRQRVHGETQRVTPDVFRPRSGLIENSLNPRPVPRQRIRR